MDKNKFSVYIALFIVLLAGVLINALPILSIIPIDSEEYILMSQAENMHNGNLDIVLSAWNSGNVVEITYIYIVNLLTNLSGISSIFWLRLPSAAIAGILTLSLFQFDGTSERFGNSFIASLLFMCCAYVSLLCFHASPIMLPSVFTILSFVSFYRWLRRPNFKKSLIVSIALALNIMITGILGMVILLIMGAIFLGSTKLGNAKNWFTFTSSIVIGILLSFLAIFVITGNKELGYAALTSFDILKPLQSSDSSLAYIFVMYLIIALLPWSVPIAMSIPWMLRNLKYVYHKCLDLRLLQRFGILIFLLSLPFFFFYSAFSSVLLLASIFFNMPLIGKILLHQFRNHSITWRVTGYICGMLAGLGAILYTLLNFNITLFGIQLHNTGWGLWNISLLTAIIISIYTLWRNEREIGKNNRYFFNIIILYLLSQNLVIGYIIPNISL